MDDAEYTRNLMEKSVVFRHLAARLGTRVKVLCQGDKLIEGTLKAFDFSRMWLEVEHPNHVYFLNMHKIICVDTIPSDEVIAIKEEVKRCPINP